MPRIAAPRYRLAWCLWCRAARPIRQGKTRCGDKPSGWTRRSNRPTGGPAPGRDGRRFRPAAPLPPLWQSHGEPKRPAPFFPRPARHRSPLYGQVEDDPPFDLALPHTVEHRVDVFETGSRDRRLYLAVASEFERFLQVQPGADDGAAYGNTVQYHAEDVEREITRR